MAGVDSLLRILEQHGADELKLGTDQPPRMFQRGSPVRLSFPPTPDEMLRHLVEPLLTAEREAELRSRGRVELTYAPDDGAHSFATTFERRGKGEPLAFDLTMRRGAPRAPAAPPPRATTPVLAAVPAPSASTLPSPRPAPTPIVTAPSPPPATTTPSAPLASATTVPPPASIAALLQQAVSRGASDVHLRSGDPAVFRVDGRLQALPAGSAVDLDELVAWLSPVSRAVLDRGQSVDVSLELDGVGRFRLNLYRASGRLAAAIRVPSHDAPALADLSFPVSLAELVAAPHGLVIVCGPTGSGKSTTLAALAAEVVRRRGALLITLEDPIEYTIAADGGGLVRQRQIGSDVASFPTALRDALREDPDVLLIGEMRDPETISLALTAAETGHLVLASLHSSTTTSAIERIVDAYASERQQQIRVQLADSLRAVVAQRLLPRARGAGRVPAVEVLRGNHSVASLIREGKTAQLATVLQSSRKDGMLQLERCLADLVRAGLVTREAATAVANDPTSLASYLQG